MNETQRILIVDDEADIRDGVQRWFHAAGFETATACDGDQGIASANAVTPHAILLDMLMPNKDGIETLAELRASKRTADIPVVMLSASLRDEQVALDAGAKFFLHKPYDGKKLVHAVQTAIVQSTKS